MENIKQRFLIKQFVHNIFRLQAIYIQKVIILFVRWYSVRKFIGPFGISMAIFSSRSDVQIYASKSRDFVDKPQNLFRNFKSNSSHVFARNADLKYFFFVEMKRTLNTIYILSRFFHR